MIDRLANLVEQFSAVPAPPGHEADLAEDVAALWRAHGEVVADRLGNTWVTVGGRGAHVLVHAHLDEVALVVARVEADGFLRVRRVGGIPERNLMGQSAAVLGRDGPVPGVFGTVAHHFATDRERGRVVPADEQYIDVGAADAADARDRLGLAVGDFVVYPRVSWRSATRLFANSLDDRAGLAVATVLLESLAESPRSRAADAPQVTVLASVQEEFNLRGLAPAVRRLAPDLVVGVDIHPAGDPPDLRARHDVTLGAGPVINHYSFHGRGTLAGVIPPRWLTDAAARAATSAGVDAQHAVFFGGLSDAGFAQLEGDGARALEVGLPCRYTHAPVETCDLHDLSGAVRLLTELVTDPPEPGAATSSRPATRAASATPDDEQGDAP